MSDIESLRAQLAKNLADLDAQLRPLAKTRLSPRDSLRSTTRASFEEAVQALRGAGWSQNAVCDALGVDIRTFLDWLEGKRQLPAWAIAALPEEARLVFLRNAMGWPSARTGT